MKTRYSGLDLACQMQELKALIGMRINKIYDIDKKTYLMKLQRTEEKCQCNLMNDTQTKLITMKGIKHF